jgi:Ribbon-helix-helix protein, copG family
MSQHVQERVPLSAFVDSELRDALAHRARLEDRSVSSVIRVALQRYLQELASTARREQMLENSPYAHGAERRKMETLT